MLRSNTKEIWTLTLIYIAKISYWCYYVIWLTKHITHTWQIMDPGDPWFLRYKTKRYLNFDLDFQAQDDFVSSSCYMLRSDYHTAYTCKIWKSLDQDLMKYNSKTRLNFDLHLHSEDDIISNCFYYEICLAKNIKCAWWIWVQRARGSWETKQRDVWTLTFICITKMMLHQLALFRYDLLMTLHN